MGRALKLVALLLAFGVFCVALFPYGELRGPLERQLARLVGGRAEIGALDARVSGGSPVLRARDVAFHWPGHPALGLSSLTLRPKASTDWLRGAPHFEVVAVSEVGHLEGALTLGSETRFDGRLAEAALDRLALRTRLPSAPALLTEASGSIEAELALHATGNALEGQVRFLVRDGALPVPDFPVSIPFDQLAGVLQVDRRGSARVDDLEFHGAGLRASGRGELGAGPRPLRAPLTARLQVEVIEPRLAPVVEALGVDLDGAGRGVVHISGTLAHPSWR